MAALAPRREQEKESKRNKNEICHRGPGLIFGHAAVAVTESEVMFDNTLPKTITNVPR